MSMPERELQDRLDDGPTEGTGCTAHQATHEIVAADFTIEPFPLPGEDAPGFSYNAEPSQLTPGWGDTRPRGPDAAKVAEIAAAISQRNTERRASWRKDNLALSSEDEQQRDLLDGNGRVKVASPDTYQNYFDTRLRTHRDLPARNHHASAQRGR
jgi:hypothetical protein